MTERTQKTGRRAGTRPAVSAGNGTAVESTNRVVLRGRLSAEPEGRTLPSGDPLVVLRVVVPRPDGRGADSLPVAVGPPPGRGHRRRPGQADARTVRRAAALSEGQEVRVVGWIQRRFWQAGDARRTRLQVVASEVEPAASENEDAESEIEPADP